MQTIQLVPKTITRSQVKLTFKVISVNLEKNIASVYFKLHDDTGAVIDSGNKTFPADQISTLTGASLDIAAVNKILEPLGIEADANQPVQESDASKASKVLKGQLAQKAALNGKKEAAAPDKAHASDAPKA